MCWCVVVTSNRKLVKKAKQHNGGVYALVTNRIVLPRNAHRKSFFLEHTRRMASSRSVLQRVRSENVPENTGRSPLRLNDSGNISVDAPTPRDSSSDSGAAPFTSLQVQTAAEEFAPSIDPDSSSPYRLVWSASSDFTVIAWDTRGRFVQQYSGHANQVRCLCGA